MSKNRSLEHADSPNIYRDQLITIGDLEKFRLALLEDFKTILHDSAVPQTKRWLKSSEVRKMLGVSPGTLQNLRVNGALTGNKIGGIVFYRYEDIARLLNGHTDR